MARYKCHSCEVEHGTDNVVPYCAFCFRKIADAAAEWELEAIGLEADVKNQAKIIEAMEEVVEAAREHIRNPKRFLAMNLKRPEHENANKMARGLFKLDSLKKRGL